MNNPVIEWFGDSFNALDPLLQALHRNGGELSGTVDLQLGSGLAGFIGRRLAKKLGLPESSGGYPFKVRITHQDGALHWARQFDTQHQMLSIFKPQGHYPEGY